MTNEQLVARIRAGENEAENMLELWQQNKGFIHKIAQKYQAYAEIEDLKQEGYIGLCEAVRHYEPVQEVPFISYAAFWIKQVMQRYIDNCCSTVRIPANARNDVLRCKKIINEYRKWYGKEPSESEMRSFLGVSVKDFNTIKKNALMVNIRSLSEPIGDDEDMTLCDTVASGQNMEEDIIKEFDFGSMKKALWSAVDALPDNMPNLLRKRYQDGMSRKETGESIGESAGCVRSTEAKALRRLRNQGSLRGYYEQYLSATPVYHVGVEKFNRTWTSSVEAEVLGW